MLNDVLVIGGGIAGITAALDLADQGHRVHLIEKEPAIGGRMAQLDKTYPTLDCSICILAPKMVEVSRHPNIKLYAYAEVSEVKQIEDGKAFRVKIRKKPRYIDEDKCTSCGDCVNECPVNMLNEFEEGMSLRKAIYIPFPQAVPNTYVVDKRGVPPCRVACPAGLNVQGYVSLIAKGKFKEALELIRNDIPLPTVCGRVCFHPCEAKCERGKVDEPLAINALKRFATDYELKEKVEKPSPIPKVYEEKVAVIGSGPAGLTAAYELVKKGYSVTVFEALPEPGGMLRVGIPEYRLPRHVLNADIENIEALGVEIRTNTPIGREVTLKHLREEYDAVLVAAGMHRGKSLGIKGEDLGGVINAIDFLREVNLGRRVEVGDRVAVICVHRLLGIDTARVALRLGAKEVNILYRRSRKAMLSHERLREHLNEMIGEVEREGAKVLTTTWPTEILGEEGRAVALTCTRMTLGKPGRDGLKRWEPVEGSEFIEEVDTVITAIGQAPDHSFLPQEIELRERGNIKVDPVTLETSVPGIFAGGEVESGPSIVITSIAQGKRAAVSIHRHLRGEDLKAGREEETKKAEEVSTEGVEKKPRHTMPLLPIAQRAGNFREIELGFEKDTAVEEAERCLSCGGCCECLQCEKVCEPEALIHQQKEEYIEIEVASLILATGFDLLDPSILPQYGYRRFPNVLTSLEYERLMNAVGPTGGKIVRFSDGVEPEKIAFIQCVGSRNESVKPYCSQICCMYATKEAIVTKEHNPKVDVSIFYNDLRASGKGHQELVRRAEEEFNIKYVKGLPSEVQLDLKTDKLRIRYADLLKDQVKTTLFDLIVLCPAVVPKRGTLELAKKLGLNTTEFDFLKSEIPYAPVDTFVPGIYLCGACESPKDISHTVAQASAAAARAATRTGLIKAKDRRVKIKEKPIGKELRIGVFICNCGINIGAVVDVPRVVEFAKTLEGVAHAEEFMFSCSEDAIMKIKVAIREYDLNRVIVASCTPRTHEPLFRSTCEEAGLNPYLFEMVNIREHDSWVHPEQLEEDNEKA